MISITPHSKHKAKNNTPKIEDTHIVNTESSGKTVPRVKNCLHQSLSENIAPARTNENIKIGKTKLPHKEEKSKKSPPAAEEVKVSVRAFPSEKAGLKYKTRLFLGEASLHYTRAVIQKHKARNSDSKLAQSIIATTYESSKYLAKVYLEFSKNKDFIQKEGATFLDCVDATKIETYAQFKGRRIKRIHFNFPHDGSDFNKQTLPPIIKKFFQSARQIQHAGDRVHMALPKPNKAGDRKFYEGYVYHIYDAAHEAGYDLIKKRKFGNERYPGYEHKETGKNTSATITKVAREYVFERLQDGASESQFKKPIYYRAYTADRRCLPELKTASDSSDYIDNDNEEGNVSGDGEIQDETIKAMIESRDFPKIFKFLNEKAKADPSADIRIKFLSEFFSFAFNEPQKWDEIVKMIKIAKCLDSVNENLNSKKVGELLKLTTTAMLGAFLEEIPSMPEMLKYIEESST